MSEGKDNGDYLNMNIGWILLYTVLISILGLLIFSNLIK